jgi:hypothetical protein
MRKLVCSLALMSMGPAAARVASWRAAPTRAESFMVEVDWYCLGGERVGWDDWKVRSAKARMAAGNRCCGKEEEWEMEVVMGDIIDRQNLKISSLIGGSGGS